MFILEKKEKGYVRNLRTVSKNFPSYHMKKVADTVCGGPEGRASKDREVEIIGKFHLHGKDVSPIAVACNGQF